MPKKRMVGVVVSDKMEKTVVVAVEKMKVHPIYQKRVRRHVKYKAHNELSARIGDRVVIEEHRPFSKEKRWVIVEIVEKNSKNDKGDQK